jgi:hypothetical protein
MANNSGPSLVNAAKSAALSEWETTAQVRREQQAARQDGLSQENRPAEEAHGDLRSAPGPMASSGVPTVEALSLTEIYEQAGVRSPAHGFTILKVADMLSSAHIRDLPPPGKRSSILMALEASGVQLSDVLEDAATREIALNDYEARQQKTFQDFKARGQEQSQAIEAEMERVVQVCRAQLQAIQKEIAVEKARVDEWRAKKREEERRIRSAASPFVPNGAPGQSSTQPAAGAASWTPDPSPSEVSPVPEAPQPAALPPQPAVTRTNGKAPSAPAASQDASKRSSFWKR